MESKKRGEVVAISTGEKANYSAKGKAAEGAPPPAAAAVTAKVTKIRTMGGGWKKGLAIIDIVLRLGAGSAAVAAAYTAGNTEQILPFFTQFFQFHAQYNDLPTFTFFVVANAVAVGYIGFSLPFSIICVIRPHAMGPRLLLVILDTVMVALIIAADGASSAIVYLAHNGNVNANWLAICRQYNDFCQALSGALVSSFVAAVFFMFLVVNSTFALKRK
ncbi:hypothetical protein ACFX1Q_030004 [Malus domestica]|uniref:casparian strip membrane protein 2-like n=1 Tax=Malus domestica TaxID=3750 RepID=UPI003977224A